MQRRFEIILIPVFMKNEFMDQDYHFPGSKAKKKLHVSGNPTDPNFYPWP